MSKTNYLLSFLLVCVSASSALAQGQGNTPYSTFGIGEVSEMSSAAQDMMGGTGASFGNSFYSNQINPALLVKNRVVNGYKYVSFNVGMKGQSKTLLNNQATQKDFGMNLNYLSLTSPITADWAMNVTLRPYTQMQNTVAYSESIIGKPDEFITHINSAKGGLSRVSYTNSFRLFKKLYLGAEGFYNFGVIKKDSTTYLVQNGGTQLRNTEQYALGGLGVKFGAAYQQKLTDKWNFNIGGAAELGGKLNGEFLNYTGTYADIGNGAYLINKPDTTALRNITGGTPAQYRFGVSLESPFHWVFAADYHTTQWMGVKAIDNFSAAFLKNTEEMKFGIEWLPNNTSTKYLSQGFYRVGFATAKTAFQINGTRIKDNKFTFGTSLPLGYGNPSYMNLGIALGRRGTQLNNLVQENYIGFSASFSLLSTWYIKPKID